MTETDYLHLKKPGQGDYYNVDDINGNSDAIDVKLKEIDESKGQPGGIATLNGLGELVQMPNAFDTHAISSRWIVVLNDQTARPGTYNCTDYITPGDVISVATYAAAQSFNDLPEQVPGKLYTLPLRTDDQGRNDLMQEYHTVTGNVWCRSKFFNGAWSTWSTSANCTRVDSGVYIDLPGGMHICFGSQTYNNISVRNQANTTCFTSETLYFGGYPKTYRYAPRCLLSLSVGAAGPYWLAVDSNGPTTTRPQGFKLATTTSTTISTVTLSYVAIGIS